MSWRATLWARGRGGNAQLTLYAVTDYADPHGIAWASQKTLAAAACLDERTISRHLQKLEQQHLIARFRRHDSEGHPLGTYIVAAPRASARGSLLDVDQDDILNGRWPQEVAECARATGQALTDNLPGGIPLTDNLPVRGEAPTDNGDVPNRQLKQSPTDNDNNPTRQADRQDVKEPSVKTLVETTRRADPGSDPADASELTPPTVEPNQRSIDHEAAEAERWRRFEDWWKQHPTLSHISDAWAQFQVIDESGAGQQAEQAEQAQAAA